MKTGGKSGNGCFYTCKVFQMKYKTPTREQAIKMYEDVIAIVEEMDDSA